MILRIFIIIVFFTSIGCKTVKYGFKGVTIPPEAKTISVAFFQNQAPMASPQEAQKFSEQLRTMVSSQTNLGLIKQNGDLQFEGKITDYNVQPVSIQSTDVAASNRLTITVSVHYSNKFDETKNFDQTFTRFSDFDAKQTLSSVESGLLDNINKQLTEDIFNKAFNNW
jgi:hypothetical protein